MDDCLFCNIVNKTAHATVLFENEQVIVIQDILPKAPVHVLVISKKHIESISVVVPEDQVLLGEMIYTAKSMAEKLNIGQSGYKLVFNIGKDGGQVVGHIHLHLLGGKKLAE